MALLFTIYMITNELKHNTYQVWLETANGDMLSALLGKLLPYTFWFTLLGIVGNIVMFGCCHFVCRGSFLALSVTLLLFILAMQAMGVFLSGLIPNQHLAVSVGGIYGMLSFSMAGFSYPVDSMPPALQALSYIFPLRHHYLAYAKIALFDGTFTDYWLHLCLLLLVLVPGLMGGLLLARKSVANSCQTSL